MYAELSGVGDFRRGTLSAVFRKCGKPNCRCARPGDPGHGPQYNLTRWEGGKTVTTHPRPGPELDKAEREAGRVGAVPVADRADRGGERGDLRHPAAVEGSPAPRPLTPEGQKGGSARQLAAEAAAEVARLAGAVAASLASWRGYRGGGAGDPGRADPARPRRAGRPAGRRRRLPGTPDRLRGRPSGGVRVLPGQDRGHGAGPGHRQPGLVSLRSVRARPGAPGRRAGHRRADDVARAGAR